MAHYAFLDENNIVTMVIVGKEEGEEDTDWEQWYGNYAGVACKQTSYNTRGGIHYGQDNQPDNGTPFRKNYAGIGFIYDAERDAFVNPKPFPSWMLNEDTCQWESPVPYPTDNRKYTWDENTLSWLESE